MTTERQWYKKEHFWYRESKDWELYQYGFKPEGRGDLIANTCSRIVELEDKSYWAELSVIACAKLCQLRDRWPSYLIGNYARTMLTHKLSCWMYKNGWIKTAKYRPRHSMTRDPYIYMYTAAAYLGLWNLTEVRPPLRLFNLRVWLWMRYMRSGKGLLMYRLLGSDRTKPDYVQRLDEAMERGIELKNNKL